MSLDQPQLILPERIIRRIQLCERCVLSTRRRHTVPGRGIAPADVLFVGEGPGVSEDIRGLAFIGPTKRIVDSAFEEAKKWANISELSAFYSNTVCCRPCDTRGGPNRPPSGEEALACFSNLQWIAETVEPKLIVLLGRITDQYCGAVWPRATRLFHPAYILRVGGIGSPAYHHYLRGLTEAIKQTFGSIAV